MRPSGPVTVSLRLTFALGSNAGEPLGESATGPIDLVLAHDAHRLPQGREEGEQVDQVLVAHRLGQAFGHQRDVAGWAILDVAGPDRRPASPRPS